MKKVLFICTGNTCRSPMAQGLFNQYAHKKNLDIQAESAGLAAMDGQFITPYASDVLLEVGVDMSVHHAHQLTREDVDEATLIFGMTENHVTTLAAIFPQAMDKILLFGRGIDDPFGGDLELYRLCRDQIQKEIPLVAKLVECRP